MKRCDASDVNIFTNNQNHSSISYNVPIFTCNNAFDFDGILIANEIESAHLIQACKSAPYKFLYVWDFEWIFKPQTNFQNFENVYNDKHIGLIARSETHARILKSVWKQPKHIANSFEVQELCQNYTA